MQTWEELKSWLISLDAIDEEIAAPEQITRLDLSGRSLESLPEGTGLLTALVALNLANNLLTSLPSEMEKMTSLSNLDIRRNRFGVLPSVLASLPLRSLNASANRLSDVDVLGECSALRVLDLSANALEKLGGCIHPDNEIRTLNLSENYLKDLGNCFLTLPCVERLNLSGNVLTEIPESVAALKAIEMLDLSDNRLVKLDEAFFSLEVETVDLSANRLTSLHLHELNDLDELTLDDNPFESLTIEDGFAPYLRLFSCDSCNLETFLLPVSTQLESLCYSSNAIAEVPDGIGRYSNLEELDLEGNRVQELPGVIENLTRVQTLYLDGNPLSESAKNVIKILHPDICDINMKTGISIEEAKRDDLPEMARLLSVLFAIEIDFDIDYDKQLAGITKLFEHEGSDLLVARHEGSVAGMVTMQRLISSAEGDYVGQIEDLVVKEDYRKMAVGSRLINKMRFMAQKYGYKRIQLAADLDNDNVHQFYTRRGFRQTNLAVYHFINA